MKKVLRKRILRNFKENIISYLALGALIILAMYMVVSLVAAAESIITQEEEYAGKNCVEDGEFTVFAPLTQKQEQKLTEAGVRLERKFHLDYKLDDASTVRIFSNREKINLIELDEGELAKQDGEAVLERRYCEEHGLSLGDTVKIGGKDFEITGIGTVPDYSAPFKNLSDSSVESKQFGLAFLTPEAYERLKEEENAVKTEEYVYAYRLDGKGEASLTNDEVKEIVKDFTISAGDIEDKYFQEYWEQTGGKKEKLENGIQELLDGSEELSEGLEELGDHSGQLTEATARFAPMLEESVTSYATGVETAAKGAGEIYSGMKKLQDRSEEFLDEYDIDISNMTEFLDADDNPRIGAAADDQVINKLSGLVAGVIVMILFTYVISVFVVHNIERESTVIGALYALGAKRKELLAHYLTLPVIVTIVASLIGAAIGFSPLGAATQMESSYAYFSTPAFPTVYPAYLVVYSVVMPVAVTLLVNYLVIRKKLSRPVLELLRNEPKNSRISHVDLGKMGFIRRFRIRQMLRELRSGLTVVFGMFVSMLILMLAVNCHVMCEHISSENKEDTRFSYMYTYKYPTKEVPEGGTAAFAKSLKKEIFGYDLDVTVIGIEKENPYFDAEVKEGKNKIVISSAMAQKYQLKTGDKVILTDEEEDLDYAFTVEGITQYSTAFYAFMDIESMRKLFEVNEDYFNVVFSKEELDIPSGRLYGVTTKADIEKSSDVFVKMMKPMVTMLYTVACLIFAVVMYLMMKVMIDRSTFSISLIKIFGFRMKEIRKLYLDGNFYIVAAGALLCIPLSKWVMDAMYPYMVANISCSMNLSFPWQLYLGIYGGVLLLYFIINCFLVRRLKKIVPAEVLKNRE